MAVLLKNFILMPIYSYPIVLGPRCLCHRE